jgi:hypothetical protein
VIRILFFCTLLACVTGYAIRRGGAPERAVAIILIAGTFATWAVAIGVRGSTAGHFITVEHGILFVDCAMLVAFMAVSLSADRFWPLWMTALHAFGIVGHLAKAIAPDIMTNVYLAAHLFSAYPGLILLTLATYWHRRRVRETGHDRSWSTCWRWSIPWRRRNGRIA